MKRISKDIRTVISYPTLGVSEVVIEGIHYLRSRRIVLLSESSSQEKRKSAYERNKRLVEIMREAEKLNTFPNVLSRVLRK